MDTSERKTSEEKAGQFPKGVWIAMMTISARVEELVLDFDLYRYNEGLLLA